ncbi:c-type cytochrome [Sphingomicrobium clamense]|uniref:Cytochrome c family protein n=1 Tax=Sphingomicrobium clamense TaxID=2851013 RepID=A0ABS6V5C2_9SPHN|nr:cytochrome c family protein [Sphingomicrobium sp. B8]MBW0144278.1 cytochrome c family protein [Sphingomicrobium sp. B8]
MDDRNNTIAGWVLFAGIIALGGTILTGEMFHGDRPETMGYPIEGVELEAGAEEAKPVAFYLASADAARGEAVFARCAACHSINQGGANGLGPALYGTMGGDIAGVPGFAYSDALASKEGNWTWEEMDAWIASPRSYAPGTKMTFAGLSDEQDRADLLLYLNQQTSNPLAVPPPPPEEAEEAAAEDAMGEDAQKAEDVPVLDEATTDADDGSSDGGQEVPEA